MAEPVRMPSGYGGLVRYYEEYKSKVQLKPQHVIVFVAIVVVVAIAAKVILRL